MKTANLAQFYEDDVWVKLDGALSLYHLRNNFIAEAFQKGLLNMKHLKVPSEI